MIGLFALLHMLENSDKSIEIDLLYSVICDSILPIIPHKFLIPAQVRHIGLHKIRLHELLPHIVVQVAKIANIQEESRVNIGNCFEFLIFE